MPATTDKPASTPQALPRIAFASAGAMTPQARRRATPAQAALQDAIRRAGGPKALGSGLGISHQAVGQWTVCPALRVLAVERLTGVSRHELRPDLYPASEIVRGLRPAEQG